ncbi:TetR/AcrR family transcriptional regulator [Streptomyces sp. NPDC059479]|uniref:TetR/AcrR family transcriptional regulator n=1 Tax=Streptomyces sp. NPDC059479 TaxID=3346848 RepID=UPI00368CB3C1
MSRLVPLVSAADRKVLKEQRILDAARELLLRHGPRGFSMAEVAALAGVGKGTVYLYWESKEDLIADLYAKDALAMIEAVQAAVTGDANIITPHRFLPLMRRTVRQHPFVVAIQTQDTELLGWFKEHPGIRRIRSTIGPVPLLVKIIPILREHGLVRTDLSAGTQIYALLTMVEGMFHMDTNDPVVDPHQFGVEDPDVMLADVSRVLLEPSSPADSCAVGAAASAALAGFDQARAEFLSEILLASQNEEQDKAKRETRFWASLHE